MEVVQIYDTGVSIVREAGIERFVIEGTQFLSLACSLSRVSKASDTAFPALIKSDERFECRLMNKLNKFKTSLVNGGVGNTHRLSLPRVFRIQRRFGICAQT